MPHSVVTQVCCSQRPCPCGRPLLTFHSRLSNTQRQVWLSLCVFSESWCAQNFVWELQASLAGMGCDSKCDFVPPTILLGLLLFPWTWGIIFLWDPIFSGGWLFSSMLQLWGNRRRRWAHVLLLCHQSPLSMEFSRQEYCNEVCSFIFKMGVTAPSSVRCILAVQGRLFSTSEVNFQFKSKWRITATSPGLRETVQVKLLLQE